MDMYKWLLSYYNMERELTCRTRCDHSQKLNFVTCVGLLTCSVITPHAHMCGRVIVITMCVFQLFLMSCDDQHGYVGSSVS